MKMQHERLDVSAQLGDDERDVVAVKPEMK
jgi:hypothetical protein